MGLKEATFRTDRQETLIPLLNRLDLWEVVYSCDYIPLRNGDFEIKIILE
jgi:hypothetical protein